VMMLLHSWRKVIRGSRRSERLHTVAYCTSCSNTSSALYLASVFNMYSIFSSIVNSFFKFSCCMFHSFIYFIFHFDTQIDFPRFHILLIQYCFPPTFHLWYGNDPAKTEMKGYSFQVLSGGLTLYV
jgi:hypothetical protein